MDLALRAVAAEEHLEPTDEQLDEEIVRLASSVKRSPDSRRRRATRAGRMGALRGEKAKSLAADFVLERVVFVDEAGAEIDRALLDEGGTEDGAEPLDQSESDTSETAEEPS